jgi:protein O-mannosyl-transferase
MIEKTATQDTTRLSENGILTAPAPPQWRWITAYRAAVLSSILALIVSLPTVCNDFVMEERNVVIVDNQDIRSLANIPRFFGGPWISEGLGGNYYRPIPASLYAIEYAIFGLNPGGWHLVNSLLYALVSALTALVIIRVTKSPEAGLFGGSMFAVLPVHVEPFAAISYQTTLLAGLFTTLALLAFSSILERGPKLGSILHLAAATTAAIMSKEEAYTIPILILAWALFIRPNQWRRRLLICLATIIPILIVLLLARSSLVHPIEITFFGGQPTEVVILTMFKVASLYLRLLIAPIQLCPFYEWFIVPFENTLSRPVLLGMAGVAALLTSIIYAARKGLTPMAIGIAWLILGLLPVLQFIPFVVVAAERYLFIPSIGWCTALGSLFVAACSRLGPQKRRAAIIGFTIVLTLMATRSLFRVRDWQDDFTLNRQTAVDFPQTPTPMLNLADLYESKGDLPAAREALEEAVRRDPDWVLPRRELARFRQRHQMFDMDN